MQRVDTYFSDDIIHPPPVKHLPHMFSHLNCVLSDGLKL